MSTGDHKAAAQAVANRYFHASIAAGDAESACAFTVVSEDHAAVEIDLADSLWDLEGDDTQ